MGMRTASDEFAKSFAAALDLPQLKADTGGSYTDSNEYSGVVSECTNISVGYYGQHGVNETQDLDFAELLSIALVQADWSKLVFVRDPAVFEDDYGLYPYGSNRTSIDQENVSDLTTLVRDYPSAVAELLDAYGFTPYSLMEECQIEDNSQYYTYLDNYAARRYV
jgi:hypothetical protein